MKRTGRLVAAAGALLVLVGGVGPAEAAVQARAQNAAPQGVSTATWAVVVRSGNLPADAGLPPMVYNGVGPFYAVMTDIGSTKPRTMTMSSSGLSLVSLLEACTTQWTGLGTCPATSTLYSLPIGPSITDPTLIPGPGVTWWLKFSTALALGGTLSADVTGPVATTSSS